MPTSALPLPGTRTTTMSLNAVTVLPPRTVSTASRGSIVYSRESTAESASGRSGTSISARNPSLPRFTPSTNALCWSASRMARSIVPSPPRLTMRSERRPSSSGVTPIAAQLSLPISELMPKTLMDLRMAQSRMAFTASAESRSGCRTRPTLCISADPVRAEIVHAAMVPNQGRLAPVAVRTRDGALRHGAESLPVTARLVRPDRPSGDRGSGQGGDDAERAGADDRRDHPAPQRNQPHGHQDEHPGLPPVRQREAQRDGGAGDRADGRGPGTGQERLN